MSSSPETRRPNRATVPPGTFAMHPARFGQHIILRADAGRTAEPYPHPVIEWPFGRRRGEKRAATNPYVLDVCIAVGFGVFALVAFFTAERTPHASGDPDVLGAMLILLASGSLAF